MSTTFTRDPATGKVTPVPTALRHATLATVDSLRAVRCAARRAETRAWINAHPFEATLAHAADLDAAAVQLDLLAALAPDLLPHVAAAPASLYRPTP